MKTKFLYNIFVGLGSLLGNSFIAFKYFFTYFASIIMFIIWCESEENIISFF